MAMPPIHERSANFGSILAKWKQMDSSSSINDNTSLVYMARRGSQYASNKQDKAPTKSSWGASKRVKKSMRLFRSKRFETSVSTATTMDLDHSDMSETLTEEDDPSQLISVKERKARILSDTFEDYYTLGKEVGFIPS